MYRSPSTSSVFWEPINPIRHDCHSSARASGSDHSEDRSSGESTPRAGYRDSEWNHPERRRISSARPPEDESLPMSTLTSALTGSKMATNSEIPTITGQRALPKALLPKAARTSAASLYQPVMVPSFGMNSTRRNSVCCSPDTSSSARRNSISGTLVPPPPSPKVITSSTPNWTDRREASTRTEPTRTESRLSRTSWTESPSTPTGSRPLPIFSGSATLGRVPVVVGGPMPRRQPVVEDSIYPMLKAALGKENSDADDKKIEDTINRQVFAYRPPRGRNNSFAPSSSYDFRPLSATLPARQSCSDDVFAPQSHLPYQPTTADATIRRSNIKSEILPSRTSVGSPAPWRHSREPFAGVHTAPTKIPPSQNRTLVNHEETQQNEQFSHPMKFYSQSPRTSLPPPPKERPPPPPPTDEPEVLTSSVEKSWYSPIPVQPRKVIRQPSTESKHSQSLDTNQSSTSYDQVFFKEVVPSSSCSLLERVERNIVESDSEVEERNVEVLHSRWYGDGSVRIPSETAVQTSVAGSEGAPQGYGVIPEPGNAVNFPNDGVAEKSFGSFTRGVNSNSNMPISHQTMDSFNTEDSGVDRWDPKEGNDQSADDELMDSFRSSAEEDRTSARTGRGSVWREDLSEGRGSMSSSPHPHSTDDQGSTTSFSKDSINQQPEEHDNQRSNEDTACSFVENQPLRPGSSILHQLLAENSFQIGRKCDDQETSSVQDSDSTAEAHCDVRTDSTVLEMSIGANYGQQFDFDSQSSTSVEGGDSGSSRTLSAVVQSTVMFSNDTAGKLNEQSRSPEENRWQRTSSTVESFRGSVEGTIRPDVEKEMKEAVDRRSLGDASTKTHELGVVNLNDASDYAPFNGPEPSNRSASDSPRGLHGVHLTNDATDSAASENDVENDAEKRLITVNINKGPVGVGFSIEGGKGSLSGDKPIVVKRLFLGETNDVTGKIRPGDELISINGLPVSGLSHYEAWKWMKELPVGNVQLTIRRMEE